MDGIGLSERFYMFLVGTKLYLKGNLIGCGKWLWKSSTSGDFGGGAAIMFRVPKGVFNKQHSSERFGIALVSFVVQDSSFALLFNFPLIHLWFSQKSLKILLLYKLCNCGQRINKKSYY